MDSASWLQATLGYSFNNPDLLEQALTHRSAGAHNNERLEFLGDAVLDFVVSAAVYEARNRADEGDLSRLRASLVRDKSLASLARGLGIGEQLRLGPGERKSGGHRRDSIVADALEALFGAIYLDSGFDAARDAILKVYAERLADLPDADSLRDPKTRLQEWLQARRRALPDYDLLKVSGEAHNQTFEVACRVDGEPTTTAKGSSRRSAEQTAARAMLEQLESA
ncbi:MAG: ribonuclease III [Pseudomonadota bacterium]